MLKELDSVRLTTMCSGCQVAPGTIGTIVSVLHTPHLAYEVEFVDQAGRTLDVCTLEPNQIAPFLDAIE